ncbi:hypothetical protein BpHYR1_035976 [Brachionus plicatilis]|uniref:Uncharacterized protein n=1 Tax=Brachionus plicatilis TaxID=10195 RepID=A0A3M7PCX3_BRAPC|nr:hypothetical protein BpHYR1_035976 [Brachionus plicatilis]
MAKRRYAVFIKLAINYLKIETTLWRRIKKACGPVIVPQYPSDLVTIKVSIVFNELRLSMIIFNALKKN